MTSENVLEDSVASETVGKKVLIIYAHQEPRSFNGALKDVAVAELSQQGCSVTVSDLYALNFEPRATGKDITAWGDPPHCFPRGLHFAPAARGSTLAHVLPSTGCLVSLAAVLSGARSCLAVALLWSLMHGTLHFCGFKVLAPQISFGPEMASEEERKRMVASWAQRLKTLWEEEPIHCSPPWYFGQ
ncbi:hypothetical protein G4228_005195 [Cervus hanglu yarkandensis]|nr:hypothetical protein G4228_005195 [Cervus hanglu yarkandensis]